MKIEIERSGGLAGITKKITVDTENLPKDIQNGIEQQLTKTKLDNRTSNILKRATPDCYFYKISTQMGNRKRKMVFSEFEVDKDLRGAINNLLKNFNK